MLNYEWLMGGAALEVSVHRKRTDTIQETGAKKSVRVPCKVKHTYPKGRKKTTGKANHPRNQKKKKRQD